MEQTEEHKRKISEKLKGKPKTEEHKQNMRKPKSTTINMKKPKSEETKIKMRKPKSEEARQNMRNPRSEEHRKKISETRKRLFKEGKLKPSNYIDGRSKTLSPARYGDDWDKIRYLIYLRDRFTCQDCGIKGIRLDIHHIIPFLVSYDNSLSNLITLCRSCHMKREQINIIKQKV